MLWTPRFRLDLRCQVALSLSMIDYRCTERNMHLSVSRTVFLHEIQRRLAVLIFMDFHGGVESKIEGVSSMEFAEMMGIRKTKTDMESVGWHGWFIYLYFTFWQAMTQFMQSPGRETWSIHFCLAVSLQSENVQPFALLIDIVFLQQNRTLSKVAWIFQSCPASHASSKTK